MANPANPKIYKTIAEIYADYPADLPLDGTEKVELEQNGNTKACLVADLLNYGSVVGLLDGQTLLDGDNWDDLLLANCKPFTPEPINFSLAARTQTPIDTGTADTDTAMKLVDSAAAWSGLVQVGDIVYNSTDDVYATVLLVISDTTLWLDWDAFPDGNENYEIYRVTLPTQIIDLTGEQLDGDGTAAADTDTTNHLIDGDSTDWITIVSIGDWAWNLNTGLAAYIESVASHDLTLRWDCFPNGNEPYLIFSHRITISDGDSPLDGFIIPELNIGGRFIKAGLSGNNIGDDAFQGLQAGINVSGVDYFGYGISPGNTTSAAVSVNHIVNRFSSAKQGGSDMITAFDDGTNGTPRTGNRTEPMHQIQRYVLRFK